MWRRLIFELTDEFGEDGAQLGVNPGASPVLGGMYHFWRWTWTVVLKKYGLAASKSKHCQVYITKGVVLITTFLDTTCRRQETFAHYAPARQPAPLTSEAQHPAPIPRVAVGNAAPILTSLILSQGSVSSRSK